MYSWVGTEKFQLNDEKSFIKIFLSLHIIPHVAHTQRLLANTHKDGEFQQVQTTWLAVEPDRERCSISFSSIPKITETHWWHYSSRIFDEVTIYKEPYKVSAHFSAVVADKRWENTLASIPEVTGCGAAHLPMGQEGGSSMPPSSSMEHVLCEGHLVPSGI